MGIPDHLTCLLRNLYAGQEATVRTGHGTMDWFQIGKKHIKAVYCHPAYLTYMQNAGLDAAQAGIKIARRNINNLRYADDTTRMAESEEELKSLLMKVKVKLFSRVQHFVTPRTVAYQASPSMGFSRQEYWSGLPFPSPGDLPDPGMEPMYPALGRQVLYH